MIEIHINNEYPVGISFNMQQSQIDKLANLRYSLLIDFYIVLKLT